MSYSRPPSRSLLLSPPERREAPVMQRLVTVTFRVVRDERLRRRMVLGIIRMKPSEEPRNVRRSPRRQVVGLAQIIRRHRDVEEARLVQGAERHVRHVLMPGSIWRKVAIVA